MTSSNDHCIGMNRYDVQDFNASGFNAFKFVLRNVHTNVKNVKKNETGHLLKDIYWHNFLDTLCKKMNMMIFFCNYYNIILQYFI